MTKLEIKAGPYEFLARMEQESAPQTCAAFEKLLAYESKVIHVRWSGEACWIPMGDFETGIPFENHSTYPSPGQILWYPGGYSETEILMPYGGCSFASVVGPLAANHFLTIEEGVEQLPELGKLTLWHGAQDIAFTEVA